MNRRPANIPQYTRDSEKRIEYEKRYEVGKKSKKKNGKKENRKSKKWK